jgi:hypothetical protein
LRGSCRDEATESLEEDMEAISGSPSAQTRAILGIALPVVDAGMAGAVAA